MHDFSLGDFVSLPAAPEWGVGQVQSVIGHRVTVNFDHAGKQLINTDMSDGLRFAPRLSIALNFLNPEKYLFEANSLERFTAFVAINEASALRLFSKIRPVIGNANDDIKNEIDETLLKMAVSFIIGLNWEIIDIFKFCLLILYSL